jgi:hypothetical protein
LNVRTAKTVIFQKELRWNDEGLPSTISLPRSGAQRKSQHLAPIESIDPF